MKNKDTLIVRYYLISIIIFFILMIISLIYKNFPNVFGFGLFALFQILFYEKYKNYLLLKEIKKLKENND